MKILFSCCNIGFGHSTRSLRIAKELEKEADVVFAIGKPYDSYLMEEGYEVHSLHEPISLYAGTGKKIFDTTKFIFKTSPKMINSAIRSRTIIDDVKPDIIVSDSDISVPVIGKKRKIPNYMITHQPSIFTEKFERVVNKLWQIDLKFFFKKVIIPDVVGLEVPENLKAISEKVGPIGEDIKESKAEIKKKLGLDKKTCLIAPSFATGNKENFINEIKKIASENPEWEFLFLGQKNKKNIGNIKLLKREDVDDSCPYMKASDFTVISGYTSLLESVFYKKPSVIIPTQFEQEKIAELAEKKGISVVSDFEDTRMIDEIIKNKELFNSMKKNLEKYKENGAKQTAELIFKDFSN